MCWNVILFFRPMRKNNEVTLADILPPKSEEQIQPKSEMDDFAAVHVTKLEDNEMDISTARSSVQSNSTLQMKSVANLSPTKEAEVEEAGNRTHARSKVNTVLQNGRRDTCVLASQDLSCLRKGFSYCSRINDC